MQIDNINYFRQHHRHIRDLLQNYENKTHETNLEVVSTKQELRTLQVLLNGRPQYIHSKYDPKNEAKKLIDQFGQDIDLYEHVLFYGIGLGYHIEEFMNRYPKFTFSIYEPNIEVFYEYTKYCSINNLPVHRLKEIFIETTSEMGKEFLIKLTRDIQERILLVVLPSYERIYQEKYKTFLDSFKEAMESKRSNLYVDTLFSARWTLNSLINFPKTISTPNILDGFDSYFKDKPLIIVSAGPSLEEEYGNLRYIKENKLAYIFAVGSANRALIARNIMPDAVCTYDPQEHNYGVFASIIEKGITSIPLIYGTSVGFETLNWYQGPKLHMITSQDTIAQYYLQNEDRTHINCVNDSPTIAAVTFQLAVQLGSNPIVFTGQNLAFKNNQYYSKDVEYNQINRPVYLEEKDLQKALLVNDVYGNKIESTPSFNNMRENIEWYISQYPQIEVINSTKGGAAIAGASFHPLEEVIKEQFKDSVVVENWYESNQNNYDISFTTEQIQKMERSIFEFRKLYKGIMSIFKDVQKYIKQVNENKISKDIVKFDKLMKKIVINDFYICYIHPVNRTQYQALTIRAANIRKQTSEVERVKLIIDSFTPYLERCKQTLEQVVGSVYKVHDELKLFMDPMRNLYKYYPSDCGVFQYEGEWERNDYSAGKSINYLVKQHSTCTKNSTVRFRFTGTELKIYGSKRMDGSNKIEVTIDGNSEMISERMNTVDVTEVPAVKQVLFEKYNFEDKEHEVEIKLLDDHRLMFSGVEIGNNNRIFHVQEVESVEHLEIGKRIRCYYRANYNKVGELSCIGREMKGFIPPESTAYPDGDFYFIMVDEEADEKKLIADRNIQKNISYLEINKNIVLQYESLKSTNSSSRFKLHIQNPTKMEWDIYLVKSDLNMRTLPGDDNTWNWNVDINSWTNERPCKDQIRYDGVPSKEDWVIIRGKFQGEGVAGINMTAENISATWVGYRPMLIINKV